MGWESKGLSAGALAWAALAALGIAFTGCGKQGHRARNPVPAGANASLGLSSDSSGGLRDSEARAQNACDAARSPLREPVSDGRVLYVDPARGDDGAGGGAKDPFRTLRRALAAVQDGETIQLRAGVYRELEATIRGRRGVTLRGELDAAGEPASVIDGQSPSAEREDVFCLQVRESRDIAIENLKLKDCPSTAMFAVLTDGLLIRRLFTENAAKSGVVTGRTSRVRVEGSVFAGSRGEHGIYLSDSGDDYEVIGNRMQGNSRAGLQINALADGKEQPAVRNHDGITCHARVEGNEILGNGAGGGAGINLAGVRSSLFQNNLLHGNRAGGIALWDDGHQAEFGEAGYGSARNLIVHNTIAFDAGAGRYGIQLINGSNRNLVQNNLIVFEARRGPAIVDRSQGNRFAGNVIRDSMALAGLGADFHLASAASPARDAGSDVIGPDGLVVNRFDRLGRPRNRGAPDAGCYEDF